MSDDEIIKCKVCKEDYIDDDEYICGNCVKKWRESLIQKGRDEALKYVMDEVHDLYAEKQLDLSEWWSADCLSGQELEDVVGRVRKPSEVSK